MGNFEKLSVLVIGVIIVMILVVAIHTWTTDPGTPETETDTVTVAQLDATSLHRAPALDATPGSLDATPDPWLFESLTTEGGSETAAEETTEAGESGADVTAEAETDTTEPEPPAGVDRQVTVKQGDTLGHISQRMYDTTRYWRKIQEANDNISPQALRPGMVLVIPHIPEAASGGSSTEAPAASVPAIRGSTYTVRRGDTIQKIAQAAYGSFERWPDIWVENLEVIPDPKSLPVGTQITLPR